MVPADRAMILEAHHERSDDVTAAIEQIRSRFGSLDILVNNAGEYVPGTVEKTSEKAWNSALASNLTGPFLVMRTALPLLRSSERGVVINVASTLGLRPVPGTVGYSVAKSGLVMLTKAAALEEAPHGVRVVVVCPGVVDTPIHRDPAQPPQEAEAHIKRLGTMHPLGRVGSASEVAAAILFLASAASCWTTGSVFTIDGGISLV